MYQTIFAASEQNETNEEVIRILVEQMGLLAGKSVSVEKQIVVYTDDINLSSALDALADSIKARKEEKSTEMLIAGDFGKGTKEPKKVKAKLGKMGKASWRNEKTGEIVSTMKLHQRMAAGEIEDNATFINFKGERWVVMDGKMIKEPS